MSKSTNSPKKTNGILSFFKLIGIFVSANFIGVLLRGRKNSKDMKKHENQHNLMYSVSLGKDSVEVKKDIQNAYFTCCSGRLDVDFLNAPINKDVYIDLFSVFGSITITLPDDVAVEFEGYGHCEKLRNTLPEYEDTDIPVIHIKRKCFFSELTVQTYRS